MWKHKELTLTRIHGIRTAVVADGTGTSELLHVASLQAANEQLTALTSFVCFSSSSSLQLAAHWLWSVQTPSLPGRGG